jgi:hypothetical protein
MAKLDENNLPKKMENIQFVKLAIESALENVSKAIKKYPDCGEYFSETINNDIEKISTSIIEVLSNINAKTENTNK